VAYVVPADGAEPDLAALTEIAAARLPDYMVPAAIVPLDALPLSPNGKLDRARLPVPEVRHAPPVAGTGGPEETVLLALFTELLGVPEVGVGDSFFELGGDSIVSIQLVARARRAGLGLMPKDVFEHKTVATLAALAAERSGEAGQPATADDGTGPVPLTPIVHWWRELGGPVDGIHQSV